MKSEICHLLCWFQVFQEALWCKSMSDAVHTRSSYLSEATDDLRFVAASTGCGCTWEGPSFTSRQAFTSTGPRDTSAKAPRHPGILFHLPLPAHWLPGLITEKA